MEGRKKRDEPRHMREEPHTGPLWVLLAPAVLVMAAEYGSYFVSYDAFPHLSPLFPFANEITGYLPWFRLGGAFLFGLVLLLSRLSKGGEEDRRKQREKSFPLFWNVLFICISIGGCLILFFIESLPFQKLLYPVSLLLMGIGFYLLISQLQRPTSFGIQNPRKRKRSKHGFSLRLKGGWINIQNPFRGILVIGAAGSGKSYSVAEPIIEQAIKKGYSGIVYDFKFPTLSRVVYSACLNHRPAVSLRLINFSDLSRTYRINPLRPENLLVMAYAEEFAQSLMSNLMPETILKKDFWTRSATAILTAVIWHLKKHHPSLCTLPHVVALICNKTYEKLIGLLEKDAETAALVSSLSVAIANRAEKQVSGMMGSLQIALARLNNPEIFWVLGGDDFSLDLNDKKRPVFLCIGTHPSLSDTLAPVVSLIITAALKMMNQQGKHHSMVLLDEGPTLYIPKFDQIPATARSNKIATIYMAQDISQMVQSYGPVNAEVILGNLNNQLYGRVSNPRTADHVSRIFGKEEKEVIELSRSDQGPVGSFGGRRRGKNTAFRRRESELVRAREVINLGVGEFVGTVVSKKGNEAFFGQIQRKARKPASIPPFARGIDVQLHFEAVHSQAEALLMNT